MNFKTFDTYEEVSSYLDEIKEEYNLKGWFSVSRKCGNKYAYPCMNDLACDTKWNPLPDEFYVFCEADEFWGGDETEDFLKLVHNATWLDLWKIMCEQMETTGDNHHSFLEGIYLDPNCDVDNDGIPVYRLSLGS